MIRKILLEIENFSFKIQLTVLTFYKYNHIFFFILFIQICVIVIFYSLQIYEITSAIILQCFPQETYCMKREITDLTDFQGSTNFEGSSPKRPRLPNNILSNTSDSAASAKAMANAGAAIGDALASAKASAGVATSGTLASAKAGAGNGSAWAAIGSALEAAGSATSSALDAGAGSSDSGAWASGSDYDSDSSLIEQVIKLGTSRLTLENLENILTFCEHNENSVALEDLLSDITPKVTRNLNEIKHLGNDFFLNSEYKIISDTDTNQLFLNNLNKIIIKIQDLKNPSESFLVANKLSTLLQQIIDEKSSKFSTIELNTLNQQLSNINIFKTNLISSEIINYNNAVIINKQIYKIN